jgi:hypothetical protein
VSSLASEKGSGYAENYIRLAKHNSRFRRISDGARGVMSGRPKAGEMVHWTISSDERRELKRAAGGW